MSFVALDPRVDANGWKPRQCVWELTLACDQQCAYCGSRAGKARSRELDTTQCLDVVDQLADAGCELLSLSGGEPTLRKDWDAIAAHAARRSILVNMVTHGVYRSDATRDSVVRRTLDAGMCNVGLSLDGPREVHDSLRGNGTFDEVVASVRRLAASGIQVVVMTTVGSVNLHCLGETRRIAQDAGASQWRVQLAKPMGKLSDQRNLVIEPRQVVDLIDTLTRLKSQPGIRVVVGDSVGYFGPQGDRLRTGEWRGKPEHWHGCQAGMRAVGIQADGTVKGCLSLQASFGAQDPFVEGSLQQDRLEAIWRRPGAFSFNRDFSVSRLRGACRRCSYARICRGGAACVASAACGAVGEDPFCYHRWTVVERGGARSIGLAATAAAAMLALGVADCGGTVSTGAGVTTGGSAGAKPDASVQDAALQDAAADAEGGDADAMVGDASDEYNCAKVDCYNQLDYAAPPPPEEVIKACCCKNVCCQCDYGPPPPEVCCK